ncbi:hypothetical protein HBH56_043850 [Parastagonospora nodorum]|uniref:Uncharacterized protein n=1 Tax=Phaeosphaeria nodorum (strain SN15 / ATCC MYA-4574 / FGSC 10173) TaxID=321614 RepID=A0A7U2ETI2_PHANO|nr:hypothetical protein HBH56_043850 [Parastagonospora nodorum]QRC92815.1 hypothetical protein JI435_402980 [Parastagonospora nodorum SN15]KAH3933123.1 hypothetical protein HBH54_071600 [Parastagonospora nodorum]KAH4004403.1 hypothetical protein HBI10_050610 [Parastagonospora nodorum]KAH4018415.1 hypothetical protein HBI13_132500 [Parastagonospora nodorum]
MHICQSTTAFAVHMEVQHYPAKHASANTPKSTTAKAGMKYRLLISRQTAPSHQPDSAPNIRASRTKDENTFSQTHLAYAHPRSTIMHHQTSTQPDLNDHLQAAHAHPLAARSNVIPFPRVANMRAICAHAPPQVETSGR